jgi:heat shock protein HslJ
MRHTSILVLFTSLVSAACSSPLNLPTSPSSSDGSSSLTAGQLTGTWQLHSIQATGQSEQPRPADATYTLTFAGDRLSTRADCNSCSGAFTVSGSTITVANALACTRAACPTMEFESAYTTLLSGEHSVTGSGSSMVWTSPRGTLRFTR